MFKKAAQIVVTFSLLTGAYLGYARGFALLAARVGQAGGPDETNPFPESPARSALLALQYARESLGETHWTAGEKLPLQWYDALHGHYIYAENYERLDEGKRLRVWKFALIWISKDGKSRKVATSDEAVIDMSQPIGIVGGGKDGSMHIVHARMTGNVKLRDDKGTKDLDDDLRVALNYVEYDESTLQITSDSPIRIEDRDVLITGLRMMIQLRKATPAGPGKPASGGSGFDAESMVLYKNVDITSGNATSTGILPGASKPDAKGNTPLKLTCDGQMTIVMPRPRPFVETGPPDLKHEGDPTLAYFQTNVQVVRGTTTPDQLNSDTLDLTLMPVAKGAKPAEAPAPADAPSGGPLTDSQLTRAVARGHAVWIQSESQGLKARCLELIHDKHTKEGEADRTYLNGGPTKQLWMEKVDLAPKGTDRAGTIESVRTVNALDATIFEYGNETSKVMAGGPGKMEERPARNASVARTVWWDRDMVLDTFREEPAPLADGTPSPASFLGRGMLRRVVTLTGPSKLVDHKGGNTLDARERIVAEFEAAPKAKADGSPGDGATRIKFLQAFEDVHLTASNRVLTARRQLYATFVEAEPIALAVAGPAPVFAAAGPAPAFADAQPEAAPPAVEPAVDGRANYVHATILQGASSPDGGQPKSEVRDAKLRGAVMVHQDPGPGETLGKEATGEALDLTSQGKGLMRFVVSAEEPRAAAPATQLAAAKKARGGARAELVGDARPITPVDLARVSFGGRTIEAPIVGLDQLGNMAWAQGPGNLVQVAERGLFDDKGLVGARPEAAKPETQDQLVITWNSEMKFFGVSEDLQGRPAAKAEFRGISQQVRTPDGSTIYRRGVEAKMEDAAIYCDRMDVYLDRIVPLAQGARKGPNEPDGKAEIAQIDSSGVDHKVDGKLRDAGVDITSRKRYPGTDIVYDKQRIQHVHVIYDKRTGDFEAQGPGRVLLYKAEQPKPGAKGELIPTAMPVASNGRAAMIRSRPEVSPLAKKLPPLKLTQIKFSESMIGRFGVSKDQNEKETRHAEFAGDVQAVDAVVSGPNSAIDFDRKPVDHLFLTSDTLHVYTEPPPPGSPAKAPARQLLNARGHAQATTVDKIIQGDRVTYDSSTDLVYVYGDQDRSVVMVDQKSLGQAESKSYGRSAYYNKRTREGRIVDPHDIQVYDMKTGARPKSYFPDLGATPKAPDPLKTKRSPLQRPGRNSTDRNGFTGH